MKSQIFFGSMIYILAAAFLCFEMALQVSPSIMTNQLMVDFKINASSLGIMSAFYFYSYTIMQIPAGLLFDRFGPRLLITGSLLICVIGSVLFGMAESVFFASAGRFFMGIGSAFAFIGVLVIAARWFPPKYFAALVGVAQLLAALGAMGGELPLAFAVNQYGWRSVMLWLAFLGVCLAVFCAMIIRDRPTKKTEFTHYHIGFLKGLKEILNTPQTFWIGLYAFCSWGPIAVFAALWGVPYLMSRVGISNHHAAAYIAMIWLGIGLVSPIIGYFSDKLGSRKALLKVCALIGLVCSIFVLYVPGIDPFWMYPLLFGIGIAGAGQIICFALVKDITRPTVTGSAIGINNMFVVAGGALFQPLVGWILSMRSDGSVSHGLPIYATSDFSLGLVILPICFLVGLILSFFFIKETYCKPTFDSFQDSLS
ncbi:MAG: MFS transporter [Simkaniaceae bacterium]|nr:MFS transporter [Simkaniaceae bacterium]